MCAFSRQAATSVAVLVLLFIQAARAQHFAAGTADQKVQFGSSSQFQAQGLSISRTPNYGNLNVFSGGMGLVHERFAVFPTHELTFTGQTATSFGGRFGSTASGPPTQWMDAAWFHPTLDMAIGRFVTPVQGVQPFQLRTAPVTNGMEFQFPSWGVKHEEGDPFPGTFTGLKYGGTNRIDTLISGGTEMLFSYSPAAGGATTLHEMTATQLGSGSFISDTNGLAFAMVTGGTTDYNITRAAMLDNVWISSIIMNHEVIAPSMTFTVVPEPTSMTLTLSVIVGGAVCGLRRWRRR